MNEMEAQELEQTIDNDNITFQEALEATSDQSADISEATLQARIEEDTPRPGQPTSRTINQMIDHFTSVHQPTTHIASATGSLFQTIRDDSAPKFERAILILGDSNVKHIQEAPKDLPVQIVSFPGATINSFHKKRMVDWPPSDVPKVVIPSVGINNQKDMKPTHTRQELQKLGSRARKQFPQAEIYMPKLNYSQTFSSYLEINNQLDRPPKELQTIPALDRRLFQTRNDRHHWTTATGRDMLRHWVKHIVVPQCANSGGLPP